MHPWQEDSPGLHSSILMTNVHNALKHYVTPKGLTDPKVMPRALGVKVIKVIYQLTHNVFELPTVVTTLT